MNLTTTTSRYRRATDRLTLARRDLHAAIVEASASMSVRAIAKRTGLSFSYIADIIRKEGP